MEPYLLSGRDLLLPLYAASADVGRNRGLVTADERLAVARLGSSRRCRLVRRTPVARTGTIMSSRPGFEVAAWTRSPPTGFELPAGWTGRGERGGGRNRLPT